MSGPDLVVETLCRMFKHASVLDQANRPSPGVWDEALWHTLEGAGFTRLAIPERAGGSGGSLVDAVEAVRLASRFAARVPLAESMLVGGWLCGELGLPVPSGPVAVVEAGPSALAGGTSSARLAGSTSRVRWGRYAELAAVVLSAEGPAVAFIGAEARTCVPDVNLAYEAWDAFRLDNDLIGAQLHHLDAAALYRLQVRRTLARLAGLAGAAEAAHVATVEYARERVQFGRPIGSFQAVAHLVAQMTAERAALECALSLALDACGRSADDGGDLLVAAAAVQAARSAGRVAAAAHQVHGAIGLTLEHRLRLSTTRLWSLRDELGSEAEAADRVARRCASGDLWEQITSADLRIAE